MNNSYYAVTTKCGHVGRGKYVEVVFPIKAANKKEAAYKARWIPRVKHHKKDAIVNVEKIDYSSYIELMKLNDENQYLHCSSIQEQRLMCKDLVIKNFEVENSEYKKGDRSNKIKYVQKKYKAIDRELKAYVKSILVENDYALA